MTNDSSRGVVLRRIQWRKQKNRLLVECWTRPLGKPRHGLVVQRKRHVAFCQTRLRSHERHQCGRCAEHDGLTQVFVFRELCLIRSIEKKDRKVWHPFFALLFPLGNDARRCHDECGRPVAFEPVSANVFQNRSRLARPCRVTKVATRSVLKWVKLFDDTVFLALGNEGRETRLDLLHPREVSSLVF